MDKGRHSARLPPASGSLVAAPPGRSLSHRTGHGYQADIVFIDEREARQFASCTGLAVMGVFGILLGAKRDRHVAKLKREIDLLRSKADFFVAASLEAKVLSAAGE